MRIHAAVLVFAPTSIFTFNCGVWQLYRRYWKMRVLEAQKCIQDAPQSSLLEEDSSEPTLKSFSLYTPVELSGRFDMQAVQLVGPRGPPPATAQGSSSGSGPSSSGQVVTGSRWWGDARGGFFLFVPFWCDEGPVVMANLGWVPIDAFKGATYLEKYMRATTGKRQTLRGVVKHEETRNTMWNTNPEAHVQPVFRAWALYRPYEMATQYLAHLNKRLTESMKTHTPAEAAYALDNEAEEDVATHAIPKTLYLLHEEEAQQRWSNGLEKDLRRAEGYPIPRYYVEMVNEDTTGRVVIDGDLFPRRGVEAIGAGSPLTEHTYYATPLTHVWYAIFWFTCSGISTYMLLRSMRRASTLARIQAKKGKDAAVMSEMQRESNATAAKREVEEAAERMRAATFEAHKRK